jgi:hypothetical protein
MACRSLKTITKLMILSIMPLTFSSCKSNGNQVKRLINNDSITIKNDRDATENEIKVLCRSYYNYSLCSLEYMYIPKDIDIEKNFIEDAFHTPYEDMWADSYPITLGYYADAEQTEKITLENLLAGKYKEVYANYIEQSKYKGTGFMDGTYYGYEYVDLKKYDEFKKTNWVMKIEGYTGTVTNGEDTYYFEYSDDSVLGYDFTKLQKNGEDILSTTFKGQCLPTMTSILPNRRMFSFISVSLDDSDPFIHIFFMDKGE